MRDGVEMYFSPSDVRRMQRKVNRMQVMFPKELSTIVKQASLVAETTAAKKAPVDTGRLRQSIRRVEKGKYEVVVYTNVNYASYQEFGTHKMRGKHFMRKGYLAASMFIVRRIKDF